MLESRLEPEALQGDSSLASRELHPEPEVPLEEDKRESHPELEELRGESSQERYKELYPEPEVLLVVLLLVVLRGYMAAGHCSLCYAYGGGGDALESGLDLHRQQLAAQS